MIAVEAKNLLPAHDLKQYRDTFVITALDQEEIFRTATIDRSLRSQLARTLNCDSL